MAKKKVETVETIVAEIKQRLEAIEDVMSFMVRSNQRFRKGQRVQFSARAERRGITRGRRVHRGRVVEAGNSFVIKVLLDGRKRPQSFHHSFFDPVGRRGY